MAYLTPGDPNKRLRAIIASILILAVVFTIRLIDLQIIQAPAINAKSYEKRAVTRTIPALRGQILDANGKVLAKTVFKYDINVAPSKVAPMSRTENGKTTQISVEQMVGEISTILEMDAATVQQKITGTGEYAQVAKKVDAAKYRKLRALDIPWLYYDPIPTRIYPSGAVAGNILGFITGSGLKEGLEQLYDKCLAGVDGEESFEKGVDGIKIPNSVVTTKQAVDGKNIRLTIDADLQYFAQQIVAASNAYLRSDWMSATIVEVKTGRILAAAEAPSVDPNSPGKLSADDRRSRIFQFAFEPGSTLKTITAATVIDTGLGSANMQVLAPNAFTIPNSNGYQVTDSHVHPLEHLTMTGVLAESSNTGILNVGKVVDWKTRYKYLQAFGLGKRTSLDFPGEGSGMLNSLETWSNDGVKRYVSMFGQGVSVTPIQSAMMYQTIGNMGVRLNPVLVDGCEENIKDFKIPETKGGVKVLEKNTALQTLEMMERVVEDGPIGSYGAIPGYRVGAKTGTAQIRDPNTGRYAGPYATSYFGVAPIEDPQFVVAVTSYKSRTVSSSLGVAAPFKRIMQQVLRTYRVPPSTTKTSDLPLNW
jgi:cell division protein FtsI (penicillin-binding protein 3)